MRTSRLLLPAVLAVSAALFAPSTRACDAGPSTSPKAKEAAPKKVVRKKTALKAPAPDTPSTKADGPAPGAGTGGRIVTRDPETGELRAATAEEVNRLLASQRTALAAPSVRTVLPDGTVRLEPGERGLAYATLERRPDGTLKPGCVTGRDPSGAVPEASKPSPGEK
jgi:hypothetical protein